MHCLPQVVLMAKGGRAGVRGFVRDEMHYSEGSEAREAARAFLVRSRSSKAFMALADYGPMCHRDSPTRPATRHCYVALMVLI